MRKAHYLLAVTLATACSHTTPMTLLVSGRGGIQRLRFDARQAALTLESTTLAGDNPSFIAFSPTRPVLYVAAEDAKQVLAFTIDGNALVPLGAPGDAGGGPPHVATDRDGSHVLVANFSEGSARVFPVNVDGSLAPASQTVTLARGAHEVARHPTKDVFYVPCRDGGVVYEFDFVNGALTNAQVVQVPNDAGPRHLAFHPTLPYAYLINEFTATIIVYHVDDSGHLGEAQAPVDLLEQPPEGDKSAAELQISGDGRFLYASIRGSANVITTMGIDANTGAVTRLATTSVHGVKPRHFSLDGSGHWLFIANEKSNEVSVFAVDRESGRIAYRSSVHVGEDPEFVGEMR